MIRKQKAGANFNQTLEKPLEHLRMQAVNTPHSTESNILISQTRRKRSKIIGHPVKEDRRQRKGQSQIGWSPSKTFISFLFISQTLQDLKPSMNTLGAEQFGSSLHLSVLAVSNTSLFYLELWQPRQMVDSRSCQQEKRGEHHSLEEKWQVLIRRMWGCENVRSFRLCSLGDEQDARLDVAMENMVLSYLDDREIGYVYNWGHWSHFPVIIPEKMIIILQREVSIMQGT